MSSSNIEGDMKRSLLDRPDAEKVFQPWWDSVEDYLLNSLLALGNSGINGQKKMLPKIREKKTKWHLV